MTGATRLCLLAAALSAAFVATAWFVHEPRDAEPFEAAIPWSASR